MQVNGLARFLSPALFPDRNRNGEISFDRFRNNLEQAGKPLANPARTLLESFAFVRRQVPRVDDLTGPLAAFRVAEAGRFLTQKVQTESIPLFNSSNRTERFADTQNRFLRRLQDRLENLRNQVETLSGENALNTRRGESADPSRLRVQAGREAAPGAFGVRPRALAAGETRASDVQSEGALGLSGQFFLNGVAVSVETTDTLFDLRDKINRGEDSNGNGSLDGPEDFNGNGLLETLEVAPSEFGPGFFRIEDANGNGVADPSEDANGNGRLDGGTANSGVRASVEGGRLVLRRLTGEPGSIDLRDDDGVLLQLGFFELNSKGFPILKETQLDFSSNPPENLIQPRQNAVIELNGTTLTASGNRFKDAVPGTELELRGISDREIQAQVIVDARTAVAQVVSLFDRFNATVTLLNDGLAVSKLFARDFELQTLRQELVTNGQENLRERQADSESREKVDPFTQNPGDLGLKSVHQDKDTVQEISITQAVRALRDGLTLPFGQDGTELFKQLSSIGIRTLNDDTVVVDGGKLEQALIQNFDTVADLLNHPDTGILPKLSAQLEKLLKEDIGRLDLKINRIQNAPDSAPELAEQIRKSTDNAVLDLQIRNLIAVA